MDWDLSESMYMYNKVVVRLKDELLAYGQRSRMG